VDAAGRIISLRGAILADATGLPVVGWTDADPAPGLLGRWPRPPASTAAVAPAVATLAPAPRDASPPRVAPEPVADDLDEDEWAWLAAIARARAVVAAPPPLPRRGRAETVPPPVRAVDGPRAIPSVIPPTVIPLPALTSPISERTLPTPLPPQPPRRFPRGTIPVGPTSVRAPMAASSPPPIPSLPRREAPPARVTPSAARS
jgi:hypothetical protein